MTYENPGSLSSDTDTIEYRIPIDYGFLSDTSLGFSLRQWAASVPTTLEHALYVLYGVSVEAQAGSATTGFATCRYSSSNIIIIIPLEKEG